MSTQSEDEAFFFSKLYVWFGHCEQVAFFDNAVASRFHTFYLFILYKGDIAYIIIWLKTHNPVL